MAEHPGQEMTAENAGGTGPLTVEPPAEANAAPEGTQPQPVDTGRLPQP